MPLQDSTRIARRTLLAAAAAGVAAPFAHAQAAWPERTIRLLLPVSPGSAIDTTARKLAPLLSARLGQAIVIENKPGSGGLIGTAMLVQSPPDGYTLSIVSATHCIMPHLHKAPYDARRDVQPISVLTSGPMVLVVHPKIAASNVRELIAYAQARPANSPMTLGNSGNGTTVQFAAAQLAVKAKIGILQVPYKGTNNYTTDLLGGMIDGGFLAPIVAMPYLRDGRLKAIGLSTQTRLPILPNVPTLAESGLPGFDVDGWLAFIGPAKLPRPIVDRMRAELFRVLRDTEFEKFVVEAGGTVVASTVKEAEQLIEREYAEAGVAIRTLGIKAE